MQHLSFDLIAYQLIQIAYNMPGWAYSLTAAFLIFLIYIPRKRKRWGVKQARRALNKLRMIESDGAKMAYLRKVNWFVYEEMILTALKDAGHPIVRNRRYTGDGGIDGRATIYGYQVLIQAKRYKSHIAAADVASFYSLCASNNKRGLFVHTGRTGKLSRTACHGHQIDIVSGSRMIDLLVGRNFEPKWV